MHPVIIALILFATTGIFFGKDGVNVLLITILICGVLGLIGKILGF